MKLTHLLAMGVIAVVMGLFVGVSNSYACPVATPAPAQPTPCPGVCPVPATSWTSLNVSQSQKLFGNTQPVILVQKADGQTATHVGDQAASSSQHFGTQVLSGTIAQGQQQQALTSGAMTQWVANMWPSFATARTQGGVQQQQFGQSAAPMNGFQNAGTWQMANVGVNGVEVDGTAQQKSMGSTGALQQQQAVAGSSQVQGYINPPFPNELTFNMGGVLRQFVGLTVENILNW